MPSPENDLLNHDCVRCEKNNGLWYEVPGWLIWGCRSCNYQELHSVKNHEELVTRQ